MEIFGLGIFVALCLAAMLGVSVTLNRSVSGFVSSTDTVTVTDSEGITANPTVPAAQPATLTVRTNGTSGSLTMTNSNHGITTGQRVDLYWAGGQCYGAVVGTVSGTTVPIASVSGGTALPSASTAITVGIATAVTFGLTGDNLTALVLSTPQLGYFVFNNGSSDVGAFLVNQNRLYAWDNQSEQTNPLAGVTPTKVYLSHNYQTAQVTTMNATAVTH